MKRKNIIYVNYLKLAFFSFIIIIGTFPNLDWDYSIGTDPSLSWLFNYIFENDLNIGKHIIFPHGPLCFVTYPLYNNVILSVIITAFLKLLLFFNIYSLITLENHLKTIVAFILAYLICLFINFYDLIRFNLIAFYCLFYLTQVRYYKYAAFFLTVYALFVKANVGIVSGVITFSFLFYELISKKDFKTLGLDLLTIIGLIITFWFLMYQSLSGLMNYFTGLIHLGEDNSTAASLYPYNNWWILTAFIFATLAIPFINYFNKKSNFFWLISFLSVFALWKYSLARQDNIHAHAILFYLIILFILYCIFVKPTNFWTYSLIAASIFLYSINLKNAINYNPYRYEFIKINHFLRFVLDYNSLKEELIQKSKKEIAIYQLTPETRQEIEDNYVDIYPWDYAIIPANNLKFQLRPVVQSYASYTSWLDKQNANFYKNNSNTDFLIWHFVKDNINGSHFSSIDNRYLLNDEPHTLLEFISRFEHFKEEGLLWILKKRLKPLDYQKKNLQKINSLWSQWIKVPPSEHLVRAKLKFDRSFLQSLKSFFYKDDPFWIYLKLENEEIVKYRIVPKNAEDGLWINPLIFKRNDYLHKVKEIQFLSAHNFIMNPQIQVIFEEIIFPDNAVKKFFNIQDTTLTSFFQSLNTFEQKNLDYWDQSPHFSDKYYFQGKNSQYIAKQGYSSTFILKLESPANYRLHVNGWVYLPKYYFQRNTLLIMEIQADEGKIWHSIPIDEQIIDTKQWNHVATYVNIPYDFKNPQIKAYLWNNSDLDLHLDDFQVIISK